MNGVLSLSCWCCPILGTLASPVILHPESAPAALSADTSWSSFKLFSMILFGFQLGLSCSVQLLSFLLEVSGYSVSTFRTFLWLFLDPNEINATIVILACSWSALIHKPEEDYMNHYVTSALQINSNDTYAHWRMCVACTLSNSLRSAKLWWTILNTCW